MFLVPNSFAHLTVGEVTGDFHSMPRVTTEKYYAFYDNLLYPLEPALMESFVAAVLDDEDNTGISTWGELLGSWISMMVGYLDVNDDILDRCRGKRRVEWYVRTTVESANLKLGHLTDASQNGSAPAGKCQ